MDRLRHIATPHMLLCALMLALGVVLVAGGAVGAGLIVFLLTCLVVIAWVLRMGRAGDDAARGRRGASSRPDG